MGKKRALEDSGQKKDVSYKKTKLAPIVYQTSQDNHGSNQSDQLESPSTSQHENYSIGTAECKPQHTLHPTHENISVQVQANTGESNIGEALNFSLLIPNSSNSAHTSLPSKHPLTAHLVYPSYNGQPSTLPALPSINSPSLASATFSHPGSIGGPTSAKLHTTYDRLEILGDAYIEVIAMRLLFNQFPDLPAGRLSQQREKLVKNETLSEYALAYKFDDRANLPAGIREAQNDKSKGGQKTWIKTMGDIFEAYVAAIILADPLIGFQTAEAWLTALWASKLSSTSIPSRERQIDAIEMQKVDPDAKNELAKQVLGKNVKLDYRDTNPPQQVKNQGKVVFNIGVFMTGWGFQNEHLGKGMGMSKTEAGMRAATEALKNPITKKAAVLKKEYYEKAAAEKAVAKDLKALSHELDAEKSEGEV